MLDQNTYGYHRRRTRRLFRVAARHDRFAAFRRLRAGFAILFDANAAGLAPRRQPARR